VLDDGQRAMIESYFQVPVANSYGSREGGFLSHQCPQGSMHITSESVIMEIVNAAGQPVPADETGEIVVTHLDNHALPFIRYRTGDIGRLLDRPCACGRGLHLMDVVAGRRTDHLVAADGTVKHALSLIYVLRNMEAVREFQVRQAPDRTVRVSVVPGLTFGGRDRTRIDRSIRRQLGDSVNLDIALVDRIDPAPSGKHRHVISEAPLPDTLRGV
jgi:phenylacetate-CoA ligase